MGRGIGGASRIQLMSLLSSTLQQDMPASDYNPWRDTGTAEVQSVHPILHFCSGMKPATAQTVQGTQADQHQCRCLLYKCLNFSEMKLPGDVPMVSQVVPVEICVSRANETVGLCVTVLCWCLLLSLHQYGSGDIEFDKFMQTHFHEFVSED